MCFLTFSGFENKHNNEFECVGDQRKKRRRFLVKKNPKPFNQKRRLYARTYFYVGFLFISDMCTNVVYVVNVPVSSHVVMVKSTVRLLLGKGGWSFNCIMLTIMLEAEKTRTEKLAQKRRRMKAFYQQLQQASVFTCQTCKRMCHWRVGLAKMPKRIQRTLPHRLPKTDG